MDSRAPLPVSLRQLQYLVAVAELGGFRRAADACHVSQPALSAQVGLAERALGVTVIERDRRGVRVSPAGRRVLQQARRVLVAAGDLVSLARAEADPFRGVFRLGVIPTVSPYLLPELAPAVSARFPDLTIVWQEDRTARLVEAIAAGELDGGVLALESPLNGLAHATIGRDRFVLAAAADHPVVGPAAPAAIDALQDANVLLLADGHCLRDQALGLCARAGATTGGYGATSLATLIQMVSAGRGVTLLPELAVPVENRRGQLRIRAFRNPGPSRTLVLAWRPESSLAAALRLLAQTMAEAYPVIATGARRASRSAPRAVRPRTRS